MYKDALASPACEAVHLTAIDADFECDTQLEGFRPADWRLWSAKQQRHEKTRFSIQAWVRRGADAAALLPPAVRLQHDEYQVCLQSDGACVAGYVAQPRRQCGAQAT